MLLLFFAKVYCLLQKLLSIIDILKLKVITLNKFLSDLITINKKQIFVCITSLDDLARSLCICLPVSSFLCLYVSLSLCLPVSLSPCLPVSLSPCLPVSLSLCLSVSLSPCLLVSLSLCLSNYDGGHFIGQKLRA